MPYIVYAAHPLSSSILNEGDQLVPFDLMPWYSAAKDVDESLLKQRPVARAESVQRPPEVMDCRVYVANNGIYSLWVR
jgi:hypothetical protein